jgi:hypothetical protein
MYITSYPLVGKKQTKEDYEYDSKIGTPPFWLHVKEKIDNKKVFLLTERIK